MQSFTTLFAFRPSGIHENPFTIAARANVTFLEVEPYHLRHGGASHDALGGYRNKAMIKARGLWRTDCSVQGCEKGTRALQRTAHARPRDSGLRTLAPCPLCTAGTNSQVRVQNGACGLPNNTRAALDLSASGRGRTWWATRRLARLARPVDRFLTHVCSLACWIDAFPNMIRGILFCASKKFCGQYCPPGLCSSRSLRCYILPSNTEPPAPRGLRSLLESVCVTSLPTMCRGIAHHCFQSRRSCVLFS